MRAMICQPMYCRRPDEIAATREKAIAHLKAKGYEFVNTYFKDGWFSDEADVLGVTNKPLFYLSKSLEAMSTCDAVFFCNGWATTRGCVIEYDAAKNYGLKIITEEDGTWND